MPRTGRDFYGSDEDEAAGERMRCNDCGRPIFYDYADEDYHHVDEPERGCFLIGPEGVA